MKSVPAQSRQHGQTEARHQQQTCWVGVAQHRQRSRNGRQRRHAVNGQQGNQRRDSIKHGQPATPADNRIKRKQQGENPDIPRPFVEIRQQFPNPQPEHRLLEAFGWTAGQVREPIKNQRVERQSVHRSLENMRRTLRRAVMIILQIRQDLWCGQQEPQDQGTQPSSRLRPGPLPAMCNQPKQEINTHEEGHVDHRGWMSSEQQAAENCGESGPYPPAGCRRQSAARTSPAMEGPFNQIQQQGQPHRRVHMGVSQPDDHKTAQTEHQT